MMQPTHTEASLSSFPLSSQLFDLMFNTTPSLLWDQTSTHSSTYILVHHWIDCLEFPWTHPIHVAQWVQSSYRLRHDFIHIEWAATPIFPAIIGARSVWGLASLIRVRNPRLKFRLSASSGVLANYCLRHFFNDHVKSLVMRGWLFSGTRPRADYPSKTFLPWCLHVYYGRGMELNASLCRICVRCVWVLRR